MLNSLTQVKSRCCNDHSNPPWDPRAVIRQTGQELTVGGVQVDVNELMADDLGLWLPGTTYSTTEDSMPYLISVTPDPTAPATPGGPPATNAGIFAVDGGIVTHVPDIQDANNLAARFGAWIVVSPAYYQILVAAQPTSPRVPVSPIGGVVPEQAGTGSTAAD